VNTFIITFRESLEASLIIGIIYTILYRKQLSSHVKFLWLGLFAAIVSSVVFAFLLEWVNSSIKNESVEKLTEGLLMVVTAGFVYYVIFWLSKHVSAKQMIEDDTVKSAAKTMGVFWMVYFTVLREGFETVMFLFSGSKMDESNFYLNFFGGILLASIIGYLIFIQGKRINLRKFFKVTSFLLVIFASGMVAYGIHEIEEFFVKGDHLSSIGIQGENEIGRVWDILQPTKELAQDANPSFYNKVNEKYIHVLHDKGSIGGVLKGFFGYNSNPNWIEFLMWVLTFSFGFRLWKKS
jgi:high-affinity iron transporter